MKKIIFLIIFSLSGCSSHHDILPIAPPCIHPYFGKRFIIGDNGYRVWVDSKLYDVPEGFITDLVSIPRPFWLFVSPLHSTVISPSILHDYFYSGTIKVSRKFADDVFYNHMIKDGASKYKAWIFWAGVRLFGWISFKGKYDENKGLDKKG